MTIQQHSNQSSPLRIAVASSGLGHVARGIETWALDTATALHERGVDVTLFAAARMEQGAEAGNVTAGPFRSSCEESLSASVLSVVVLPSLRRGDPRAKWLARMMPGFTWRWALKSDYGWEQLSFWWLLLKHLRRGKFDILHVQDPMLAYWCHKWRKLGLLRTKEILAHGTEEPGGFVAQFEYVQHLTPWHLAQSAGRRLQTRAGNGITQEGREEEPEQKVAKKAKIWVAIPNFVDTTRFSPISRSPSLSSLPSVQSSSLTQVSGFRFQVSGRPAFGVPADSFVIGTVAAVKKHHKRIDYLIREFGKYLSLTECTEPTEASGTSELHSHTPILPYPHTPFLLVCGARTDESDELIRLANTLVPGRVKFLFDLPRDQMPDVYRSMDVFVLPSLFEMMPISVLEAMASGLPVITSNHPNLAFICGCNSCGLQIDVGKDGELAECLAGLSAEQLETLGRNARDRAVSAFSEDAIIHRYIEYYREVAGERAE